MNGSEVQEIINTLGRNEDLLVIVGLTICFSLGIVFGSLKSIFKHASRERTRREIAAYIAEGSITPEHGERILRAEPNSREA